MGAKTNIEWTESTWNPVSGCTEVSPGCDYCYAKSVAERFRGTPGHYYEHGFDVTLRPDKLDLPLRWAKPRRIFVNSMSDLFHDSVPDEYIVKVFAVMARAQQHTFQLLTKRHGRMRSLLSDDSFPDAVVRELGGGLCGWPLRNVWLGVSVENQQWADIRIPALRSTPAAVRFLSMEPLLGAVDLHLFNPAAPKLSQLQTTSSGWTFVPANVDWVIVGGESGRGARPMHPAWVRSIREQCQAVDVPFLFKQWGEWAPSMGRSEHQAFMWENGDLEVVEARGVRRLCDPKPTRYVAAPTSPRPGWVNLERVGKKAAGRELDGRTWDEYPGGEA